MCSKLSQFLLPFLLCISLNTSGQTSSSIPADFIETNIPKVRSSEWYSLNNSSNEFSVKIINKKLHIRKVSEVNHCEFKLTNGSLMGTDQGEWGGKLTFKPLLSTKDPIEIKKGNIKFLFSLKDKIYFIEGIAHGSINEGSLFELLNTEGKFSYQKILDFDDAPEAFSMSDDTLFIATHQNFYIVKDFKKHLIFEKTFWQSLYPNSIAVLNDRNVFLGIRGGIVKLDLTAKTMKFYKKR
ncbi:MAG: hypothetical protein V4721_01390 [Bacteroidota bacterium]